VISTLPRSGTYHASFATTADTSTASTYAYTEFSGLSEVYTRMDIYIDSSQTLAAWKGPWLIQLYTSGDSLLASYGFKETNNGLKWACRFGDQNDYASSALVEDHWYTIEAYYRRGTNGNTVVLSVDGVEVASLAVDTSADAAEVRVGIPYLNPGYSFRIYADNVAVSNTDEPLPPPPPNQTLDVEIFSDNALTQVLSSVTWGALEPGASMSQIMYIRNNGDDQVALSLTTEDWAPAGASDYLQLSWNYDGSPISPGEVIQITMVLDVSSSISGIDTYNFNIIIFGTIL